jgi:hypothetical protein
MPVFPSAPRPFALHHLIKTGPSGFEKPSFQIIRFDDELMGLSPDMMTIFADFFKE